MDARKMTVPFKGKPIKAPVPEGTQMVCEATGSAGKRLELSYWDIWFAIVAMSDFEGDIDRLAVHFRSEREKSHGRDDAARKLSHLRGFQQRLKDAGVSLAAVIDSAGAAVVSRERLRAPGRILRHNERQHERSESMLRLPHDRLYPEALRIMWPRFPVSPEPYAQAFARKFRWDKFYGENASWGLAKKLDSETERAKKLADKGGIAEAQAMLRSLMTVVVELMQVADDSYGSIGDSFHGAFQLYRELPHQQSGIKSEVFWSDMLEFLVWEDFGLTYDQIDGYFARLTREEADFCLDYLRERITALQSLDLDYQVREALTLIGQIVSEQKRFELFTELAKEMGSREWRRIVLLADAAEKAGKRELAAAVLQAAMTEGAHLGFLQQKHKQLLRGEWNPDPRK